MQKETQKMRLFPRFVASPPNYRHSAVSFEAHLSRGHRIIPVNDELDNILCATISEAYNLTLAGAGFALIPEHLALPHKELAFLPWNESPHAPMGIYCRGEAHHDNNSAICKFIIEARSILSSKSP